MVVYVKRTTNEINSVLVRTSVILLNTVDGGDGTIGRTKGITGNKPTPSRVRGVRECIALETQCPIFRTMLIGASVASKMHGGKFAEHSLSSLSSLYYRYSFKYSIFCSTFKLEK